MSVVLILVLLSGCSGKKTGEFVVEVTYPEGQTGQIMPVIVELPQETEDIAAVWAVQTQGIQGKETVYAQTISDGQSNKIVFLASPGTETGGKPQRFVLRNVSEIQPPGEAQTVFTFDDRDGKFLTLSEDGAPVMTYVYGMNLKEDVPEDRTRSSYIHPVYGLDGEILTDDFPEDHLHHRGIFVAWPQIIVDGDSLELWHIQGIEKHFERWLEKETGAVFARLSVQTGWYTVDKKVVEETFSITSYKTGKVGRILDIELTLEALDSPVKIIGSPSLKGYGGFNFRMAPFEEPVITTNEGIQADSDLRRSPWADFSAYFEGRNAISGVAVFDNAGNINTPNGWTLRHYGFLGVAWPGNNPYLLQPGKPFISRYRVWVHRGDAEKGMVSSAHEAYAVPPQAVIVK